ncbi:YczE/YyaS/YitT family protein [Peribacillus muralis]|uniref:YczE/YyaS/YitT family protein n=1 Tax=Peribacillus muralis TaxID=264697 RepID=UPI003D0540B8
MRFIHYVTGIMILTLGCSLMIQSNLGTSPFDALLVGLTTQVGLTVGSWEVIIAAIMIVFNALLNKQRPEVLGLITAFITGIGIDLWLFLLQPLIQPEHLLTKLFCVLVGLTVLGLGTAIYLYANFAPIPVDRSMLIIQDLTGMNILYSKTLIYFFFLGMALAFSGPIGIGTLLTVCLGGPILNYFSPLIRNRLSTLGPSANDKGKNQNHSL